MKPMNACPAKAFHFHVCKYIGTKVRQNSTLLLRLSSNDLISTMLPFSLPFRH